MPEIPEDDTPEAEAEHEVPDELVAIHEGLQYEAGTTEQDGSGVVE